MGWFANVLLVVGLWMVGDKVRWAFLFTIIGEAIWVCVAIARAQWDMAAICAVFAALAVRNWIKWASEPAKEVAA